MLRRSGRSDAAPRCGFDDFRRLWHEIALGLGLAAHGVLELLRDVDVPDLDGVHGDAPRVRLLVENALQFGGAAGTLAALIPPSILMVIYGVITEQSIRLGQWMDWGNDYFTFSDTNIEYVWRMLKTVHERDWLYLGHRSTEWCPRCGTSISQHELFAGEYKELEHPSLFVRFPLKGREEEALAVSDRRGFARFVSAQNHYSFVHREAEDEILPTLRERGVTIILTTHYIDEAEEMADRVGVINNGDNIYTVVDNVWHVAGLASPALRTASFTARWSTDSWRWWRRTISRGRPSTSSPRNRTSGC